MSVLNRKMFNRGGRNKLNQMGGIKNVQHFQTAGQVSLNLSGGPFAKSPAMVGTSNIPLGTIANPNRPKYTVNQMLGRPNMFGAIDPKKMLGTGKGEGEYFTLPTDFKTPSEANLARIVRQAAREGFGSLSATDKILYKAAEAQYQASLIPKGNVPGMTGIKGALKVAAQPVGGISGALQSLIAGDPSKGGPGGYMGSGMPSKGFLESLGGKFLDVPTGEEESERFKRAAQARATNIAPKGTLPSDILYSGQEGRLADRIPGLFPDSSKADPGNISTLAREEIAKLLDKQEQGFEVSPPEGEGGIAFKKTIQPEGDFEEFSELQPALTEEEKFLENLKTEEAALKETIRKQDLELEELVGQKLGRGVDGEAETVDGEPLNENNSVEIINKDTNKSEKIVDPQKNDITTPINRPDNWSEIVASAKANTGVENKSVEAGTLVKMDREKGLGTVEDFKSDLMKLLPKYGEDDGRDKGLYLAMIGFSIAAGGSPNPIANIANGVMKILPSIMKDRKDKKKYEREVESIAAQYAVKKDDIIQAENRKENNYFVQTPFEDPVTGEKYSVGQMLPMNKAAYNTLKEAGFGGNLTSEAIYEKILNENNELAKSKVAGVKPDNINKLFTAQKFTAFGVEVDYNTPSAAGRASGLTFKDGYVVNPNQLKAVVTGYSQKVGEMQTVIATIDTLKAQVMTGGVSGVGGVQGRFKDAFVELVGEERAQSLSQTLFKKDLNTALSAANSFEASQRMLTLKLTPLLLGESAKTISDADRLLIAQAMGFENATVKGGTGGFGGQLDLGTQSVFTSRKILNERLAEVETKIQEVIGLSTMELNKFAEQIGKPLDTIQPPPQGIDAVGRAGVDYVGSYSFNDQGSLTKDT